MNRIEKIDNKYILTLENGEKFECKRWYEKKVDTYHVLIPKGPREICGRTYIREKLLVNGVYEFENKTEHRTGMTTGGWRSKLTPEETKELEEYEKGIERLKKIGMEREIPKVDPNSIEGIERMIQKLLEKQKKLMENQK